MQRLPGIASSHGIAIGVAHIVRRNLASQPLAKGDVDTELIKYVEARTRVEKELDHVARRAREHSPTLASIVETHALIVADPVVCADIEALIRNGSSAHHAVKSEFEKQIRLMLLSTNSLIRDRAADLQHVEQRLIAELEPGVSSDVPDAASIIVADTLTPAEMFGYAEQGVQGFVLEEGGIDSHVSIIARDLGLPALVSVRQATSVVPAEVSVVLDGNKHCVIWDLDDATLIEYQALRDYEMNRIHRIRTPVSGTICTLDGVEVRLLANVDTPLAARKAHEYQAMGIGLVRTEMMLTGDGTFPTLEQQAEWYADILRACSGGVVTFRAFDIGGDKFGSYSPYAEQNPVLGLRGIRFLLAQPDIFEQQIRALFRVAVPGRTRLMLPMITSYAEVIEARAMIDACRIAVESEREEPIDVPVGIMIETPAAAIMSDVLAQYVDFVSIGTNDLTQYTLAADRANELVSNMFDCIHPSVIRLIDTVVQSTQNAGIDVSICGEMAAQVSATEILLGLGVRQLSVAPYVIPELQHKIQHLRIDRCQQLITQISACRTSSEVRAVMIEHQERQESHS